MPHFLRTLQLPVSHSSPKIISANLPLPGHELLVFARACLSCFPNYYFAVNFDRLNLRRVIGISEFTDLVPFSKSFWIHSIIEPTFLNCIDCANLFDDFVKSTLIAHHYCKFKNDCSDPIEFTDAEQEALAALLACQGSRESSLVYRLIFSWLCLSHGFLNC